MFALKLKELRTAENLSQKDLAAILNVSTGTVGNWEVGAREPGYEMTMKIANYFGITIDELLGRNRITQEERAAGWRDTKRLDVTPDEEDLIYWFREIGKIYGKEMQQAQLTMFKNLAENKK